MSVEGMSIIRARGVEIALLNPQSYARQIYIEYPVGRPRVTSIIHKFALQIGTTKYVSGGQNVSLGI